MAYFDLNPTIYMTPEGSLEGAAQKHRNTKTEAATENIGGGNSTGAAAEGISTCSNVFIVGVMGPGSSRLSSGAQTLAHGAQSRLQ
jgi:hypothetical protein